MLECPPVVDKIGWNALRMNGDGDGDGVAGGFVSLVLL